MPCRLQLSQQQTHPLSREQGPVYHEERHGKHPYQNTHTHTHTESKHTALLQFTQGLPHMKTALQDHSAWSEPTLCDIMEYNPPDSSVHGIFQANTGMGGLFLLQRIFLTQGQKQCFLNWQADSLPLSHPCFSLNSQSQRNISKMRKQIHLQQFKE